MKKNILFLISITIIFFTSCDNEPVALADINTDIIEDPLLNYMRLISDEPGDEEVNCIQFNYAFTLYIFDAELNLEQVVPVYDNTGFLQVLENLDAEQEISISYPISGTLNNGEPIEINTNDELYDAINDCSKELQQTHCNNTLVDCDWIVAPVADSPNNFEGAHYKINNDGTVAFYYENLILYGTWVTLYLGDTLYLNVDLNDNLIVENFWNHNWEVTFLTSDEISLLNETNAVSIKKECNTLCDIEILEACEMEDNPGFGLFNLTDYIPCISIDNPQNPLAAVSFQYFETEEDAINNTNAIDAFEYTNTQNPQTIWVRITHNTSGELIAITTMNISVTACTTD